MMAPPVFPFCFDPSCVGIYGNIFLVFILILFKFLQVEVQRGIIFWKFGDTWIIWWLVDCLKRIFVEYLGSILGRWIFKFFRLFDTALCSVVYFLICGPPSEFSNMQVKTILLTLMANLNIYFSNIPFVWV